MRNFAEMPVWLLALFIGLAAIVVIGLVAGMVIARHAKNPLDKVFGLIILVFAMFITIPVFLVGLITTVPAESAVSGISVMSILTEVVVWSSLLPLVIVPVFIASFLVESYYSINYSTKSKSGKMFSFAERHKNPAQNLMNDWKASREGHRVKAEKLAEKATFLKALGNKG